MTNIERKDYYFNQAEDAYKQMQVYWDNQNWNMVIRRAQEVIELLLKGVLKFINVEFPKEHDIGSYFEKILIRRKIEYDKNKMDEIINASKELTAKRAPAYYGEEFYPKEDADQAKQWANLTKKFIEELMKKLTYKGGGLGGDLFNKKDLP